jgi:hypothetical protein
MLPAFLINESDLHASGDGQPFLLPGSGRLFLITLGITHVVEQESIDILLYGSSDGVTRSPKPLLAFPQKFYPGTSQLLLDLHAHPDVHYLHPKWTLNRWGRGDLKPCFGVYLFIQEQERLP